VSDGKFGQDRITRDNFSKHAIVFGKAEVFSGVNLTIAISVRLTQCDLVEIIFDEFITG
jgi:hypothetical protein